MLFDQESKINPLEFISRPLMEAVRDPMYVHRYATVGSDHGPFLEVSDSACRMLEYSREELLTMTPWDIIDRENNAMTPELKERIANEPGVMFEQLVITKSGKRLLVEVRLHLFEHDGETYTLSIHRDITEKKKEEEELRTLRSIIPLCSFCKKVRDDQGYWEQVEVYIQKFSQADISHGVCPDCMKKHYPEYKKD